MSKRKVIIGSVISAVIIFAVVWIFVIKGSSEAETTGGISNLQGIEAVPGVVAVKVEGPSVAEPYKIQTLRMAVEGVVTFAREEGEMINKGDVLVELDEGEKKNLVTQAQINLSKAKLNRGKDSDLFKKALDSLEGKKKLFKGGAIPEDQVDEAQAAVDSAEYALKSAELDLSQARLALAMAMKDLENTKVYSPFSGVVISSEVIPGDVVSKGAPLVTIADISKIKFTAEVDEFDIGKVKKGLGVTITSDSLGDAILTSKVDSVSPAAEIVNNISIFKVSAFVDNKSGVLKPGMSADLSITINRDKGIVVPSKAVSHVRTRSYIKVFENNEVKTKKVTTGADNGINIVVLEGLEEGEIVVVEQAAGFNLTNTQSDTGSSVIPISVPGVRK